MKKGRAARAQTVRYHFAGSSKRDKICSDRNPKAAAFGDMTGSQEELTAKGHKGTLWGNWNVLDAALGGRYSGSITL